MCALPNANTVEPHPCSGLTPTAFPEAKSRLTGVSVRYAPDATGKSQWHLFRASYGREDIAADRLADSGIYTYIPRRWEMKEVDGRRKKVLRNILPNLVFAYLTPADAATCINDISFLTYYYDHFHEHYGKNPPLTIPTDQMHNLILATQSHDENLMLLREGNYTFKSDEEVEVTQGTFRGVRGRIVRAGRQQRVCVTLTGLGSIATAYIPSAFLRKVEAQT